MTSCFTGGKVLWHLGCEEMFPFTPDSRKYREVACSFSSINTVIFILVRSGVHVKCSNGEFSNTEWLSLRNTSSECVVTAFQPERADKMGTEAAAVLKQTLKDLYLKSLPAEIFLFKCKAAEKQSKAQDTANQNCSTKPYSCYKTL